MTKVATIYYDEKQRFAHVLVCEVSDGGEHTVLRSTIESVADFQRFVAWYWDMLGAANVNAYRITEVPAHEISK